MEINYLDRFNPDTMVLGSLCIRGHNHKAGQSIRYSPKNNKLGACIQCKYEYHHGIISKFEYPKNPPNILNIDYNKIKYAYILGATKAETKALRKLFLERNKVKSYPKERGK